jgi:hypothetical protein
MIATVFTADEVPVREHSLPAAPAGIYACRGKPQHTYSFNARSCREAFFIWQTKTRSTKGFAISAFTGFGTS